MFFVKFPKYNDFRDSYPKYSDFLKKQKKRQKNKQTNKQKKMQNVFG